MFLYNKRFREERLAPLKFVESLREGKGLCRIAVESLRYYQDDANDKDRFTMAAKAEEGIEQAIGFFSAQLGIAV